MELFKNQSGLSLSTDELIELIEYDLLNDMIDLIVALDALELEIDQFHNMRKSSGPEEIRALLDKLFTDEEI